MKKILCLILALCCVLSTALIITSCDKGGAAPQDPATQTEDPDKAFFDAVAASRATEIKTLTYYTYIDEDGEEKSFNGTFETSIKANGDFVFDYTYQRAAKISDVNDPAVTLDGNVATIPGTIITKTEDIPITARIGSPPLPRKFQISRSSTFPRKPSEPIT